MACPDHKNIEIEKIAKYPAHSRASIAEKRPPTNSRLTSGTASEIMADEPSSPRHATRETESATCVANSNLFSLAQRLAKKGIEAAPAACASTAMGAVKSCFA